MSKQLLLILSVFFVFSSKGEFVRNCGNAFTPYVATVERQVGNGNHELKKKENYELWLEQKISTSEDWTLQDAKKLIQTVVDVVGATQAFEKLGSAYGFYQMDYSYYIETLRQSELKDHTELEVLLINESKVDIIVFKIKDEFFEKSRNEIKEIFGIMDSYGIFKGRDLYEFLASKKNNENIDEIKAEKASKEIANLFDFSLVIQRQPEKIKSSNLVQLFDYMEESLGYEKVKKIAIEKYPDFLKLKVFQIKTAMEYLEKRVSKKQAANIIQEHFSNFKNKTLNEIQSYLNEVLAQEEYL